MKLYALFIILCFLLLPVWFLDPKRPVPGESSLNWCWKCIPIGRLQFIVIDSVSCALSVYPHVHPFVSLSSKCYSS